MTAATPDPAPDSTQQVDAVKPDEAGTPIFDEVKSGAPEHADPLPPEEAQTVAGDAPDSSKSFKVDVERALARETQDGRGDSEPGPSNFESFATEGVEEEVQ